MTGIPVAEAPGGTVPAAGKSLSDRLPRPWLFPLLAIAATWVMIVLAWNVGNVFAAHKLSWVHNFWTWDSSFYARIAQDGYGHMGAAGPPGRAAFFPLYPMAIKAVMLVIGGHVVEAGLITQILADAASAVAVWALASHVYGHRVADRAVLLYCAFPGATVLGWMYSEPLGIALAASCLLAAIKREWLLAGVLALLAGADHSTMIVLGPVLGIVALHAIWTRRDWRALLAPALAPLGVLAFFAIVGHQYHDYLFWFRVERTGWHEYVDFGAHTLSVVTGTWAADWAPLYYGMVAAGFWIALGAVVLLIIDRAPLPVTLSTAFTLAICSVSQVSTKPRYVLTMVGIFLIYAAKLPRWAFWPVLIATASLEAFLLPYWAHTAFHGFPAP